jgi:anti-sigma factor RsiW
MTCLKDEEWINRYLDGELSPSERRRFQQHLAGCPACQRDLARTRALFAVLEGLQDAPVPAGLPNEVLGGLSPQPAPRFSLWVLAAQVAATLLFLGLAYPQLAIWYEQLGTWFAPGWLSSQIAHVAAWGRDVRTWLVEVPASHLRWSWPQGFGLTWSQAAVIVVALISLWWIGNQLLLAGRSNRTGGIT